MDQRFDALICKMERSNDKLDAYQKETQWVVQLAFTPIASATITVILTSVGLGEPSGALAPQSTRTATGHGFSMTSPFPGMDPYLEQPSFWASFHSRLMVALADAIEAQLQPGYYVEVETRTYLIDYRQPPPPPALTEADQQWIAQRLPH